MNDDRLERGKARHAAITRNYDALSGLKRRSLERQALWLSWELGALLRRTEIEARRFGPGLREAIAVLDRLAASTAAERDGEPRQRELF